MCFLQLHCLIFHHCFKIFLQNKTVDQHIHFTFYKMKYNLWQSPLLFQQLVLYSKCQLYILNLPIHFHYLCIRISLCYYYWPPTISLLFFVLDLQKSQHIIFCILNCPVILLGPVNIILEIKQILYTSFLF